MNRRQYLARSGAAGASVGLTTAIAGCLGGLSDSAETSDVAVSDRTGERAIARAAGQLNKTAQSLNELGGLENPEAVDFDPTDPRDHLSTARDHLATAESELGEDRQADVETLRSYADALAGLVSVTVTVTDDTIDDDIDAVNAALEADGDLAEANRIVDDRYEQVSGAHERHAEATETIAGIDGDRLDELAGVDLASLEDGAATLGGVVTSLETLAGAYDATLDEKTGYGALERGRSKLENGEYAAAQSEFATAESTFADAQGNLESGTGSAPEGLVQHFETAACQTSHLTTAAGAFAEAAGAAADGDAITARDRKNDGEAALERVGDCSN